MKRAATLRMGSLSSYRYGEETYDPDKLGLGKLMVQRNSAGNEGKWAGPTEHAVVNSANPTGVQLSMVVAVTETDTPTIKTNLVMNVEISTASTTRRAALWRHDILAGTWAYIGMLTLTPPSGTNHTIRASCLFLERHTTGTVSVSGTTVTGSSTLFSTERIAVGARIGFGSTNAHEISSWYNITAIGSDTSITLDASPGTIAAGTPYVIEEIRVLLLTTNSVAASGGLFLAKGLSVNKFMLGGTIGAAAALDNQQAVYWLKSAATETCTVGNGIGVEPRVDWQTQYVWAGTGTTTQQLFKHNIRAALTVASGASTNQFLLSTAVSATVTGTITQSQNMRFAVAQHGPGSGVGCIYFTTTTRIYRTKATSSIAAGDTTFLTSGDNSGNLTWPASNMTFTGAVVATLFPLDYSDVLDKFVFSSQSSTGRGFVSQYTTTGAPLDRVCGNIHLQNTGNPSSDSTMPITFPVPDSNGMWTEGGILYTGNGAGTASGCIAACPIGVDWEYAATTGARLIFPRMALPDGDKLTNILAQESQVIGGTSGYNLGVGTEPHRLYYRTGGITDNSGAWTAVDQSGTVTGDASGGYIQVMAEFRAMGFTMGFCSRIHSLAVIYDDTNTDSHYQFSADKSSAANKRFAWWFATAFGSTVPALRVRIYDSVTGSQLVDDNTTSPTGTWERSTDGTTWSAWNSTDRGNTTTYLRYTPLSIADNVNARVVLTLA